MEATYHRLHRQIRGTASRSLQAFCRTLRVYMISAIHSPASHSLTHR
jgi:hypothetical protein